MRKTVKGKKEKGPRAFVSPPVKYRSLGGGVWETSETSPYQGSDSLWPKSRTLFIKPKHGRGPQSDELWGKGVFKIDLRKDMKHLVFKALI